MEKGQIDKSSQQQYLSAISADNLKAKNRIGTLRAEIERLDEAYGKTSPDNCLQDIPAPLPIFVSSARSAHIRIILLIEKLESALTGESEI